MNDRIQANKQAQKAHSDFIEEVNELFPGASVIVCFNTGRYGVAKKDFRTFFEPQDVLSGRYREGVVGFRAVYEDSKR